MKIAIDGPAGSGKSTTAKIVADKLNYTYIDTGAMYRAVTFAFMKSINNEFNTDILKNLHLEFKKIDNENHTFLNGIDISTQIRSQVVADKVSKIAIIPEVREKLIKIQRKMGKNGNVVLDGRDIGTVVFPDAELKIYLIANLEARAKRRYKELRKTDKNIQLDEIRKSISLRDKQDTERGVSPLRKAYDAISIDTTALTIEEQVDKILDLVKFRAKQI